MNEELKECVACFESIKAQAKLCKHCGVMQDDVRFATATNYESTTEQVADAPKIPICSHCGYMGEFEFGRCVSCGTVHSTSEPTLPPKRNASNVSEQEQALAQWRERQGRKTEDKLRNQEESIANAYPRETQTSSGVWAYKFLWMLIAFVAVIVFFIALSSQVTKSNSNSGGGKINSVTNKEPSGHNKEVCTKVYVPNPNADKYGMIGDHIASGTWQQECKWVWVPN